MAFKEVVNLDSDVTITLGGINKKTGKANPKQIEGYYLGFREVENTKFNVGTLAKIYYFQTAKGNVAVWGKRGLDSQMPSVPKGAMTRVTHVGMAPTPRGDMHKYKVEVDDTNTTDVNIDLSRGANSRTSEDSFSSQSDEDYVNETSEDVDSAFSYESKLAPPSAAKANKPSVDELLRQAKAKAKNA